MSLKNIGTTDKPRYTARQSRRAPMFIAVAGGIIGAGLTLAVIKLDDYVNISSFAGPFASIVIGVVLLLNAFEALKLRENRSD
jgi:hypothetical protein